MRKATAAKRLAVLKGAAVAGVFATAALASGTASAQVFVITAGGSAATNGSTLASDIATANSNGGSNTIVISAGAFAPNGELPVITDPNLTITSNHALQSLNGGGPIISGAGTTADAPILGICPAETAATTFDSQTCPVSSTGGVLTLAGVDFRGIGVANGTYPAIDVGGTMTAYSSAFQGIEAEAAILVDATGTATLTESLIGGNLGLGLDNEGGTVTLNNDTIASNSGGLTVNGTTNVNYSIFTANTGGVGAVNCSSQLNESSYDVDSDDSCVAPGDTTSKTGVAQTLGQTASHGGPTVTDSISSAAGSTNPALGLVPSADCQITDQRFFIHTGTSCDAGSYQDNATPDTTLPLCPGPGVITQNGQGQDTTQTITLSDPVGLGPEGGLITDVANAQQSPPIVSPNPGNDQADVIDGTVITNGSVQAPTGPNPFSVSGPSLLPLQITATKTPTNLGQISQWSFYATNWAGLTKYCD